MTWIESRERSSGAALALNALALAALATHGACARAREAGAPVEVADSAGVRVVTHHALEAPAWPLEPDPLLDLGATDGAEATRFFRISSARRLRDGGIAVFDGGSGELRVFASDGTHVRSFGRRGEGPGEFMGPGRIFALPGDSLAIWDERLRRLSIFQSGGTLGRIVEPVGIGMRPRILTVRADGGTLFEQEIGVRDRIGSEYVQQYSTFLLYDGSGELLDSLPTQPRVEIAMWGEGPLAGPRLFDEGTELAGDTSGYWVGTTKIEELRRYALAGELELIVRWPAKDRTIRSEDVDADLRELLASLPARADPVRAAALHRSREVLERFPSHGLLLVDRLGALWVQEFERPGRTGPTTWRVHGADGVLLATVRVPRGHRVLDVGEDYVLASGRDDLGVEHVRLFGLTRR